jgi:hypothetical protein
MNKTKQFLQIGILGFILTLGLVGCQAQDTKTDHPQSHFDNQGDLHETTKNTNSLPTFVKNLDSQIGEIYKLAAQNQQLLQSIPCYCGCGESVDHRSSKDCFVKEMKQNGQVTWDSHGTKCGTCLEIAAESVSLQKQGKTVKEIREYIDNKYKDDFAKPTPTPKPM